MTVPRSTAPVSADTDSPTRFLTAPRAPRLALALGLALGLALLGGCDGADSDATPGADGGPAFGIADGTIRVVQLNRLQGHAEGVPCADGHPSALLGAALLRDQYEAEGDLSILACVGETLNRMTVQMPSKAVRVAVRARADEVLSAMGEVGVDLFVPGHVDLGMGFDEIIGRAHALGIPVVLSNYDGGNRDDVHRYVIMDNGGPRIACLGVIPARTGGRDGKGSVVNYNDTPMLNAVDSVRQLAAKIRAGGEADFVAVFGNLSQVTTTKLMDLPDVDFVFGSQEAASRVTPIVFRGNAASFAARALGKEIGLSTIRIVGGNLQLADLSHRHQLPDDIDTDAAWFEPLAASHGTRDPERLAAIAGGPNPQGFRDRASLYLENLEAIEVMNHWGDSSVDHQLAEVPELPDQHPLLTRFDHLGGTIDAALLAADLQPPPAYPSGPTDMPGPESCRSCHETQYDFWRGTAHANAFEPVRALGRAHDPSCLRCHTTGYGLADGFRDVRIEDPLSGVSCLACHAATSAHVNNPRLVMLPNYTWTTEDSESCTTCHTPRRTPGFDPLVERPALACPDLDSQDPVLAGVAEGALEAVARRREKGTDDLLDDYVEARSLITLGRAEGVDQLVRLEAANEDRMGLAIQSARLLNREGFSAEAQQVLRRLLESQMGDPAGNRAYIELLLFPTDESVRDAGAALARIRMLNPEESDKDVLDLDVLRVDALFVMGRTQEARAELDALAKVHRGDVRVLKRLHRWWPEWLEQN